MADRRLNMSPGAERRLAMAHIRRKVRRGGAKKEDLVRYAEELGLDVQRSGEGEGEPTKDDYLKALGL